MRGLFPILIAAFFALHAVLGCCWHHAHRCTQACAVTDSVGANHLCDGDHSEHAGPPAHSHGHHGGCQCRDAACVYVTTTRVAVPAPTVSLSAVPPAVLSQVDPSANDFRSPSWATVAGVFLPPARLHLLCQVWLI
jgi:hypothetical protein